MNLINKNQPPSIDQALKLKSVVSDIVQCCQDRSMFEAQTFGLPQAELRCLLLFKDQRYLTAKDICGKLEVGKSRVTKLVEGLLAKDMINRTDDPRDGRIKLLSLTVKGRDKLNRVDQFTTQVHSKVLTQLEPAQRATVFASLEQLWNAMEAVRMELGI